MKRIPTNRTITTASLTVVAIALAALVVGLVFDTNDHANANSVVAFPARIHYTLDYQATPDRNSPLVHAEATWTVRSFSDWEFEFHTGLDAGTVYSLRPNGVFSSSDGRTESSTQYPPGTGMVPLPDMAFASRAKAALFDGELPEVWGVDRGESAQAAAESAAIQSGFPVERLRGIVITRTSTSDAFEYDPVVQDWIATSGEMSETIVVDEESMIVVLREELFNGELLRRVAVTGIEYLN